MKKINYFFLIITMLFSVFCFNVMAKEFVGVISDNKLLSLEEKKSEIKTTQISVFVPNNFPVGISVKKVLNELLTGEKKEYLYAELDVITNIFPFELEPGRTYKVTDSEKSDKQLVRLSVTSSEKKTSLEILNFKTKCKQALWKYCSIIFLIFLLGSSGGALLELNKIKIGLALIVANVIVITGTIITGEANTSMIVISIVGLIASIVAGLGIVSKDNGGIIFSILGTLLSVVVTEVIALMITSTVLGVVVSATFFIQITLLYSTLFLAYTLVLYFSAKEKKLTKA